MDACRKTRNIFAAAVPFVMSRCKESGGFGATPMLPATIQDTYHALNILFLVRQYEPTGETVPGPGAGNSLRTYLAGCRNFLATAGTGTIFQLLWSWRSIGLEFNPGPIAERIADRMRHSDSLEELYYCARILTEVLDDKWPLPDEERSAPAVLNHGWRGVDEAWMHIRLSLAFRKNLPLPKSELIAWLRACQNGDGGFGFFPKTTSFVENSHACLRALTFLGGKPPDPLRAALFLAGCQTASGGFGRSSRAAPFLDATWHALAALSSLCPCPYLHGEV